MQTTKILEYEDVKKNMYTIDIHGTIKNINTGRTLSTFRSGDYVCISLQTQNHESKAYYLHRLVACTFLKQPDENHNIVHHIDFNSLNYGLSNLKFVTRAENLKLGKNIEIEKDPNRVNNFGNGSVTRGEKNGCSRLKNKQVIQICKSLYMGKSYGECCLDAGLENNKKNRALVYCIANGLNWTHISSIYGIKPNHDIVSNTPFIEVPWSIKLTDNTVKSNAPWSINLK